MFVCLMALSLTSCNFFQRLFKLNETSLECDFVVQECKNDEDVINNEGCYKVYSDLHIFGGWREVPKMRDSLLKNLSPKLISKTIYIGDIYDIENARSSEYDEVSSDLNKLRNVVGDLYVRGNHELDAFGKDPRYKKIKNIVFIHGHHIAWHPDRVRYWEKGKKKEFQEGQWEKKYKTDDIPINAFKFAKSVGCDYIVYGHTHPLELKRYTDKDITAINVRSGCTYLQFDK